MSIYSKLIIGTAIFLIILIISLVLNGPRGFSQAMKEEIETTNYCDLYKYYSINELPAGCLKQYLPAGSQPVITPNN